jgi:hypothetical protein
MKKAHYFFVIIIIFCSCNNIPKDAVKEKADSVSSTNNISVNDLSGELFYLGDTSTLKLESSCNLIVSRLYDEIHNEGLFDAINLNSILFAKNNLIKINFTNTQQKGFYVSNVYGNSINKSIEVKESFSSVLKYSLKGDTLLLPATTVFNYTNIPSSKYKIKIQGDTLVYLTLILNSDELSLRRENIRSTLSIYNQSIPPEYTFDKILDAMTNSTCTHAFLKLKYE